MGGSVSNDGVPEPSQMSGVEPTGAADGAPPGAALPPGGAEVNDAAYGAPATPFGEDPATAGAGEVAREINAAQADTGSGLLGMITRLFQRIFGGGAQEVQQRTEADQGNPELKAMKTIAQRYQQQDEDGREAAHHSSSEVYTREMRSLEQEGLVGGDSGRTWTGLLEELDRGAYDGSVMEMTNVLRDAGPAREQTRVEEEPLDEGMEVSGGPNRSDAQEAASRMKTADSSRFEELGLREPAGLQVDKRLGHYETAIANIESWVGEVRNPGDDAILESAPNSTFDPASGLLLLDDDFNVNDLSQEQFEAMGRLTQQMVRQAVGEQMLAEFTQTVEGQQKYWSGKASVAKDTVRTLRAQESTGQVTKEDVKTAKKKLEKLAKVRDSWNDVGTSSSRLSHIDGKQMRAASDHFRVGLRFGEDIADQPKGSLSLLCAESLINQMSQYGDGTAWSEVKTHLYAEASDAMDIPVAYALDSQSTIGGFISGCVQRRRGV